MKKNTIPKPKKYDNVEMADYSKTDGFVKKIIDDETVLISWFVKNDYDEHGMILKENRLEEPVKIKSLAITRRC